jgi:uncharacterized protein
MITRHRFCVVRLLIALLALAAHASNAFADTDSRRTTLVASALAQVGVTTRYDGSYTRLAFPNGDVPLDRGVCTDVVIRAYRAIGIDLQQRVHDDMRANFPAYPNLWGLKRTDRNIDHRRVPNLARFFQRHDASLPISDDAGDYLPGDIVTWKLPSGVPHIGIVSDRPAGGRPLIVHNIGAGTQLDDALFAFEITGHFRYLPAQ